MDQLSRKQREALVALATRLVNQEEARVIVEPVEPASGYWFGGGNIVKDEAGRLLLSGRYRNYGDSRTGIEAGTRGFEAAIFASDDGGESFEKVRSWTKADLGELGRVLSIEGVALWPRSNGQWEFFVSNEKDVTYPEPYQHYQKPGTGVWQIDRMVGQGLEGLDASTLAPALVNREHPQYLHIKDPYLIATEPDGGLTLGFCSHPLSWASSNSGVAVRADAEDEFKVQTWEMLGRGPVWDVAATRVTSRLPVPALGLFADAAPISIYFYDGAECIRLHEESERGYSRPRGYSCEELGGALYGWDEQFPEVERLSMVAPLFISPWGTGASRYVTAHVGQKGIFVAWEQSQPDESQPLVANFLPMEEVEKILKG